MKSILKKIFIDNWQRKILAIIIAIITWFFINNSLTVTKSIPNVSIKVRNISKDKTVAGMQPDGTLAQDITITITGNQKFISLLQPADLEINIDVKDITHDFTTTISKHHLVSKNPNINIERTIKTIKPLDISIQMSKLVKERIPIQVTKPIGEPPKGYQFLDIWPYQLYITVKGAEEIIKDLKTKGIQLTFNFDDISKKELDIIKGNKKRGKNDIINFFVPTMWKKVNISNISPYPLEIDDPNAKALRLDFIKKDLIPLGVSVPITLYFPQSSLETLNPNKITLQTNEYIKKIDGIYMLTLPLYARGVNDAFIELVKDRLNVVILVEPKKENLDWNLQGIVTIELEKDFINKTLTEESEEQAKLMERQVKEKYLSYLFRSFMHSCRLWLSPDKKLKLYITLKDDKIHIIPNE
ncbi:MAG: hypothetical protein KR126chlam6_00813 [Candidatus Anoxychlamydiales bacterium]|nr:hypothetical protein [Candidatus Anoxychlamydiales bacterium]